MVDRLVSAAEQLARKLRHESRLREDVRRVFRRMADEARAKYKANQQLLDAEEYSDDFTVVLKEHYRKVVKDFGTGLRKQGKAIPGFECKQEEAIDAALLAYAAEQSAAAALAITETNRKMLAKALADAIADALERQATDATSLANGLALRVKGDGYSRASTIALTETQKAAEGAKQIELKALVDSGSTVNGKPLSASETTRVWTTILDNVTRDWHARADGQRRLANSPFTVNGESLMFPGDMSLGASLDNIINCRCVSDITLDLPETEL